MNILLVEDDASIVSALTDLLHSEGFSVQACATQDAACEALARTTFDIALLDVTLPQGNGFAVCAAAREAAPEMPVIFLTASDDEYSTVAGLDMGAVDYIAKPFRARELVSRIRSALRRAHPAESALLVGDVRVDPASGAVTKAGKELFLSALEYRLLLFFFQHKGKLVTREVLPYLLQNFLSAGRTKLHVERIVVPDVSVPEQKVRQIRDTVPSLRLDGIVSSGFSISRGKAAEYISAGKCELNYAPCVKGDKQTAEGDVITVRGLGKIRLDAVGGNTKKGRICVEITRFL